ncbi:MAG: hypothetical protein WC815_07805 [Vicinamibacterales bacterium]|jgi:hypothetical protein
MMNPDSRTDDIALIDVLRPLKQHRRRIMQATAGVMLLVAAGGGLYYRLQPVTKSAVIGFRTTFDQAQQGRYPNGLKFSEADIIGPAIVDAVIETSGVAEYCSPDMVRGGLSAQQTSPALRDLTVNYERRMSRVVQNAVDLQRIDQEFSTERSRMRMDYELRFTPGRQCSDLPDTILTKMLPAIIAEWARDAVEVRGVLALRPPVEMSPLLDRASSSAEGLSARLALVRIAVNRLIAAATAGEASFSELEQAGGAAVSLVDLRLRLQLLLTAELDPQAASIAATRGQLSDQRIREALQYAQGELDSARQRVEIYRGALREYSSAQASLSASSEIVAAPNVAVLDRLIELSATNLKYRRDLSQRMVEAGEEAVEYSRTIQAYREALSKSIASGPASGTRDADNAVVAEIVGEVKRAVEEFMKIQAVLAQGQTPAEASLYRVERPTEVTTVRTIGGRTIAFLVLGAGFLTLILSAAATLVLVLGRDPLAIETPRS